MFQIACTGNLTGNKIVNSRVAKLRRVDMRRTNFIFLVVIGLVFSAAAYSQAPMVGSPIESFSLPDTAGSIRTLKDLSGKNGAVIVFLSAQCPVVRGYVPRINQLA